MTDAGVVALVAASGGVARTRRIQRLGASAHEMKRAVAAGRLLRPARGWVCLPSADPLLVAAARAGVVLTCVTQARRLGVWTTAASDALHLGAPPHGTPTVTRGTVHWRVPPLPRHPDDLVDPIENVLVVAASCQPFEHALAMWESAFDKGLVSREAMSRLALPPAARRILAEATPWSGSGLESFVPPRLRWLRLPIRRQIWIAGHRVDFLIGDRLVLQVDGGTHVGPQREEDIAYDARLMLLGYHVIRVGYGQVMHRWHEVQDLVMRSVAQGLHCAPISR